MPNTKTIRVPHLGGIDAAYQMPHAYDSTKPTVVLINSFSTSSELYRAQYSDKKLTDNINLLSIELLGHGQTRTAREHWTYWDTAEMNLQVLDALGIEKAFVLGTSQGGWVTVMMALLRPEKIQGILPLGTSLDSETERTRSLGCWDGNALLAPFVKQWTVDSATPDFEPSDEFIVALISSGFNNCSAEVSDFWRATIKENYRGDEGQKRIRMAATNLAERGGLHLRLPDVRCPVLWLHGTADVVYSVANAKEEIAMFTRSSEAKLQTVEGGAHFLSCTHPKAVNKALLEFVNKHR
ncbi:alpha/beta fold hydrolase [Aspergillus undulatus]|uniref:alpha/beta fold hydrolase n=1 Tax=Aspergillus undulatus TaxID=1810928 RepID=UPI003CCDD4F9